MDPSPAALRHVRGLARAALALEHRNGSAIPGTATSDRIAVEDVVSAVSRHRLADLLDLHAEELGLPGDLAARIAELRAGQRQLLLVQQLELGTVHGIIDGAGVPCLVLKGLPLAVQTTGEPGARGPGDIDLLVPADQVARVHQVLAGNGWRLREDGVVSPGSWAWRHVLRNTCALTYVGPGSNIDLHWRLDTTVDSLPAFDELWSRRALVTVGGRQVPALAPADALGQSAFHAAKDRWRWLRSLVDIHRLAGMGETWEQQGARDLHRLEIVTLAVTRAALGLPAGVPPAVLARIEDVPARTLERALRDQVLPALKGSPTPGLESALNFRYLMSASTTPRDVARSVVATTLPVKVVTGIESRTAWTGVPVALWRRAVRGRRRALAWARRDDAPVAEIVRTP